MPAPTEDDVLLILLHAIKELGDGGENFQIPDFEPVDVEWVRPKEYRDRNLSEQQCDSLVRDFSPQIMYVHGGGHFQGSLDVSRSTAATPAGLTGGDCLSVSYRLAPQHPFPAAILDTLLVNVSMLYPPPDSPHKSIPAASIVLCGDRPGATICFAVVQVIIQAQRRSQTRSPQIWFHGKQVLLQLPAGLAALSPYGDLTHSMPSGLADMEKEYLPPLNPTLLPSIPNCEIWPTKPPRVNALCDVTVLHYPLVSPVAVVDWTDFPPFWLCFGEMMADEGKFMAQRAVPVVWEQYGAMPHCFGLLPPLNTLPQAQQDFGKWADFCRACVEQPKAIKTKGNVHVGR